MNRILTWFLIALLFAMSGPLQAASMASRPGFRKSLYGRFAPWADKYAYCGGDPINASDPSGLIKANADFTGVLLDYLQAQHRAGNLRQYRHPDDLIQAGVKEADRILSQLINDSRRGPTSQHKEMVRDLAMQLKAKIDSPDYVWGFDPTKEGEYAGTPADPTTDPRTKATQDFIKDITPGTRRFSNLSIEENIAAFFIHEGFHALRSDRHGTNKSNDHDDTSAGPAGKDRGPVFWFTRGVLNPYWSPAWGPSQW